MQLIRSSRQIPIFFVIATFCRVLSDTMSSGLFFTLSLKYTNESTAAFVLTFSLLLTFLFSPLLGFFIDKKILNLKSASILYFLSCLGMVLFLIKFINFEIIILLNLLFMSFTTIPIILYLNILAGMVIKGKSAQGYGLNSLTNTLASIIGGIIGAFLVTFDQSLIFWVFIKIIITVLIGIFLLWIKPLFELLIEDNLVIDREKIHTFGPSAKVIKDRGMIIQTLPLTTLESTISNSIDKTSLTTRRSWYKIVILLSICIFLLTMIRSFALTIVSINVFTFFDNDIFIYTTISNLASLVTLILFPLISRIVEKIGTWRGLSVGILIHILYLGFFLLIPKSYLTVLVWSLPIWPIVEISYLDYITERVSLNRRSQTIGIVNSAIALGSMIGTFVLTISLNSSYLYMLALIPIFLPIFIFLFLIPIKYTSE